MAFELVLEPPTLERMETKLSKVTVVSYADFRAMIAQGFCVCVCVLILGDEIKHYKMS